MKRLLNVETRLKHFSKPLLSGFGGELSKPTLMRIMYLAREARQSVDHVFVFPDSGNKQCEIFYRLIIFEDLI